MRAKDKVNTAYRPYDGQKSPSVKLKLAVFGGLTHTGSLRVQTSPLSIALIDEELCTLYERNC
jgi:hypothetical protein